MAWGKLRLTEPVVMRINSFNAEAFLSFGCNTKFDYKLVDNESKLRLVRNNIDLTIPNDPNLRYEILEESEED